MRFWKKATSRGLLFSAFILSLTLGPAEVSAQSGNEYIGKSWAEIQQALHEVLLTPERGDDIRILEAMREIEDPGRAGVPYGRSADELDRAFGYVYVSDLEGRIHNFPHQGTDGISPEWFPVPGGTSRYRIHYATTLAVGVEDGPWGGATVIESLGYYQGINSSDWEAKDGQRGGAFADPPQLRFSYPLMAISNLEATWPESGWPAPEDVEAVWWGTETWKKWERRAEAELYGEFDDNRAGRDDAPATESYPLGIDGKIRALAYAAYPAMFVQYELTNTSSHEYTNVFIGYPHVRDSPWVRTYSTGFPRWDGSRNMVYAIGKNYDPGAGTHEDYYNRPASFGGLLFLETPTGSFKADDLGNFVDRPDSVLTRLSLSRYGDRVTPSDHKWSYYAALSGDVSYFEDPTQAVDLWKTGHPGQAGAPVLMQTEEHYNYLDYGTTTPSESDIAGGTANSINYPSAGPFTWGPGETIDFVVATVAGYTEQDLQKTADKVIRSYQAQFSASGPPPSPRLQTTGVSAGPAGRDFNPNIHAYPIQYVDSGSITLTWDGSEAESYADPITLNNDFQGYRIYRSMDRGATWGTPVTDEEGNVAAWKPIAQFDLDDGVTGRLDAGSYLSLGEDTGLVHTWTDENIRDGIEYWYAITAYDYDPSQGADNPTFEGSRGSNPNSPNVLGIIAGARPSGFSPGAVLEGGERAASTVLSPLSGPKNDGTVTVDVLGDTDVVGGTYRLTFADTAVYGTADYTNTLGVTLTNTTTGDVLYESMLPEDVDFGTDLLPLTEGFKVNVETGWNAVSSVGDLYEASMPDSVTDVYGYDFYPAQFVFGSTLNIYSLSDASTGFFDIEVRFDGTETQNAYYYDRTAGYVYFDYAEFPGTVWDVSDPDDPRQINVSVASGGGPNFDIDAGTRYIHFLSSDYSGDTPETVYTTGAMSNFGSQDANFFGWWDMAESGQTIEAAYGQVAALEFTNPVSPSNVYEFTTAAAEVVQEEVDLDEVVVVPNPYYVFAEWDKNVNQRKIQFRNVPPNSTVDIYTLSGELIASLGHDEEYNSTEIGTVDWKIWTYEYTEAAYGLYLYVVKTADGQKKVGKFAIIR
ncbi:MAG: hypothetical protein R6W82_05675 [bacterium]